MQEHQLAVRLDAQDALQAGLEQLQLFAGPQGEHLREMWSELVDSHPDVWDAELRDGSPTVIATVMLQAQRKLTRAQADADAEAMFERLEQRAEQPADAANATLTLQTLARLRSVSCRMRPGGGRPASAFLEVLPVAPTLRLSDRDFRSALQLRLRLLEVLSAAIGLTCGCKRKLCETDAEHALLCKLLSGASTLRHDILVGFGCRAASRAGIASSKEPVLRQLQRQEHAARRRARGDGQRGDALFVLHEGVLAIDVSVVHPAAEACVTKERQGLAQNVASGFGQRKTDLKQQLAAHNSTGRDVCAGRGEHRWRRCRGARKVEKSSCGQAGGGYDFEPVVVETYGRLGEPAFELPARLARVAAESGKVDEGKFIETTLKVALSES